MCATMKMFSSVVVVVVTLLSDVVVTAIRPFTRRIGTRVVTPPVTNAPPYVPTALEIEMNKQCANGNTKIKIVCDETLGSFTHNKTEFEDTALPKDIPSECDPSKITEITVQKCGISGHIPEWFAEFTELETIILKSNKLTGVIPERLFDNENLDDIIFSDNYLSGTIPSNLAKTPRVYIHFLNNDLTGPVPPNIKYNYQFYVSDNRLSGELTIEDQPIGSLDDVSEECTNNCLSGEGILECTKGTTQNAPDENGECNPPNRPTRTFGKLSSFLEIGDLEQDLIKWLPAEDSCEIVNYKGNPNCVQTKAPEKTEEPFPRCNITFGGKRVEITTDTIFDHSSLETYMRGCKNIDNNVKIDGVKVGSVIDESLDLYVFKDLQRNDWALNYWRICFQEESTKPLSECNAD